MILHLGVVDIPYAQAPKRHQRKAGTGGTQTTGDVAGWLENRYHVMEIFAEEKGDKIAAALEDSLAGALESAFMGAANMNNYDPTGKAMTDIEDAFKVFLSSQEIEKLGYPGVPTQAAQDGVNRRLKHPYQKRAARPSFIDTGLYQSSFKAWID
jgi:hypothetical protein